MGETATEAQDWWGEAPALALIFAKSLAGFDDIVREADSLPSRGPSAAHLQPRLGLIDRLLDVGESGLAARQRVGPIRDNLAAPRSPLFELSVRSGASPHQNGFRPFAGAPTRPIAVSPLGRSDRFLAGELG